MRPISHLCGYLNDLVEKMSLSELLRGLESEALVILPTVCHELPCRVKLSRDKQYSVR